MTTWNWNPTTTETVSSRLAPVLLLHDRLRDAGLDDGLEVLLPVDLLPELTSFQGLPVRHLDGLDSPRLAHVLPVGTVADLFPSPDTRED